MNAEQKLEKIKGVVEGYAQALAFVENKGYCPSNNSYSNDAYKEGTVDGMIFLSRKILHVINFEEKT